jgi:hypothetical protein
MSCSLQPIPALHLGTSSALMTSDAPVLKLPKRQKRGGYREPEHPFKYMKELYGARQWISSRELAGRQMEHEAGVEPACFGFKAQRGCRQPTTRVLAQAAGIGPAWAAFRAQLGCQQPTPE